MLPQIIKAPLRDKALHTKSLFLAGTIVSPDWRKKLQGQLSGLPITIYNPDRPDWGSSSWNNAVEEEQIAWELEKQEAATVVAFYFGATTDAPVSLLELGLCAKEKKAVVLIQEGYKKKSNILAVCKKYGILVVESERDFEAEIKERMRSGLVEPPDSRAQGP